MSRPARSLPNVDTRKLVGVLARAGLAEFATLSGLEDSELPSALRASIGPELGYDEPGEWEALCAEAASALPMAGGPMGRLIADFELDLPAVFLLGLAGETETSHLVNLTMAALQSPSDSARPTVHLVVAMTRTLFGPGMLDVQRLVDSELVLGHALELDGDGPTPLRRLHMNAHLWSALCGRAPGWPDCEPIVAGARDLLPAASLAELPKIAALLSQRDKCGLVLRGNPGSGRAALAAELAATLGMTALAVPIERWHDDAALAIGCRYADWLPVLKPGVGPGEVWQLPRQAQRHPMVVLLGIDGAVQGEGLLEVELGLPIEQERRRLWAAGLGDDHVATAAAAALLSGPTVSSLAANARILAERSDEPVALRHVGEVRRELGMAELRLMAQPVRRHVTADALVVPPMVAESLDRFVERARHRELLWTNLGITLQATRNPGVRALFVGESGTGKTLAASYVATSIGAPLYRVDLAAVMNKYVGESEKNLGLLLDRAAASDVMLLFDEADSLFGRRTDGKQTGERYANMLTNFLLSRIETHPGIVVLTTNSRERIDSGFTRRLDVIVEFPAPGFDERLRLWRSHLGERSPGEHILTTLASHCDLVGGQIRNAVLAAAAHSANREHDLDNETLIAAVRREYEKLGRTMPAELERLKA